MKLRFIFYPLIISLISACSNLIQIDVRDHSASFSNIEAYFPFPDSNSGVILRGSEVSGEFNQFVGSGKQILIENTSIFGPSDVNGTGDLTYFSIAISMYPFDRYSSENFSLTQNVGLAQTSFDLTLQHAGTTYQASDSTTELYIQFGGFYAVSNSLVVGATLARVSERIIRVLARTT